ncbi:MAG TPA: glycogen synthase GlgA [Planctomycetaceae bacterium]|nr:glycogen synthase GlgA [Planctomycetaceae bacterium]
MNVLFATSEAVPFAKTGGLADVSASLPQALAELGHTVSVFMPAHRCVFHSGLPLTNREIDISVPIGNKTMFGTLWEGRLPGGDVPYYFIRQDRYFDRETLYSRQGEDYADNCERFVFFCRAVMESVERLQMKVDVLHSNDWQTGLLPAYLKLMYGSRPRFHDVASVHTIHNLAYQGAFWHWDMVLTGIGWEHFNYDEMEFYGKLNLLKTGVVYADAITTVSPHYAQEIQTEEYGCGMDGVLRFRKEKLRGILNGISTEHWDPATDPFLAAPYDIGNIFEQKPRCKADLQRETGLPERSDLALVGMVGRLACQKGLDLVCDTIPTWVENHGVQYVILGTGDPVTEMRLRKLAETYPQNVAVRLEFSDSLAHRIEAGADLFLMPSRYEPCGLNQMYSQIYGTLPIVRNTGGLADTVLDGETGFVFENDSVHDLNTTIWRALQCFWEDRDDFNRMIRNAMRRDWSWKRSAEQYVALYEEIR